MSTAKLIITVIAAGALTIVCPMALGHNISRNAETVTFEESFLDLSGVMTVSDEKTAGYTVYIFEDGSPSDTFQVTNRQEQHYMLPVNHNYALKFVKPGYKERIMLVNTHINEKRLHDVYSFRYQIGFLQKDESNTFDDFPVAFVHYDQQQKDFDYNRTYHTNVRTDIQPSGSTTASKSWH